MLVHTTIGKFLNLYGREKYDRLLGQGALLLRVKDFKTNSVYISEGVKNSGGNQHDVWIFPTAFNLL